MVMTDHGQIGTTPRFDHSRPSHHQRNSRAALQCRALAATQRMVVTVVRFFAGVSGEPAIVTGEDDHGFLEDL